MLEWGQRGAEEEWKCCGAQEEHKMRRRQEESMENSLDTGVSVSRICSQTSTPNALLESSANLCAVPLCSVSLVPCRLPPPVPAVRGRPAGHGQRVPEVPERPSPAPGGSLPAPLSSRTLRPQRCLQTWVLPTHTCSTCQELPTSLGEVTWNGSCSVERLCPAGRTLHLSSWVFFLLEGVSQDILQPEMEHL